jgi:transcription elongation factor Elf1
VIIPAMASLHVESNRQARRMVRLQRSYTCPSCAAEHHSWARLSTCPGCGHSLVVAVIKRAAFVGPA